MMPVRLRVFLFLALLGISSAFSPGFGAFPRPLSQQSSRCGPKSPLTLKAAAWSPALSEESRFPRLAVSSSAAHPATKQQQRPVVLRLLWSFVAKMAGMFVAAVFFFSAAPSMCNAAASSSFAGTNSPKVVLVGQAATLTDTQSEVPEKQEEVPFKKMTMKELLEYKRESTDKETDEFIKKIDHKPFGEKVVQFLLKVVMPITLLWMFIYLFVNNQ